ncbi:MAG: winged helix-turn-helix transcriptional regulator, partial [Lentisphaerae bacterium]|nr:winged helix-turn-helix transcriptional regulator [Lentisphaerota bacterium]
ILDGVATVSRQTIVLVQEIRELMKDYKLRMRSEFPKIYRQELLNNLFRHPYTKISVLQEELNISRPTANRYLDILATAGYLEKRRVGRSNYYINTKLLKLFFDLSNDTKVFQSANSRNKRRREF